MNAQPNEESSSIQPGERKKVGEVSPSQELLDEIMEGPRKWAEYFNEIILNRFPAGGRDLDKSKSEEQMTKQINGQLKTYEHHWLKRHLAPLNDQYQSLLLTSSDILPQRSELSFHIINRYVMPQWNRVLVSSKYPKMETFELESAQILLAMESASILNAKNNFNQEALFNNELLDIDAMISLLQLSIDGDMHGVPNVIALPHPEIGSDHHQADFLLFEPTYDGLYEKVEVKSSQILDPALAPGSIAVDVLNKVRISSISRRPEFQEKGTFSKLLLAREKTRSFNQVVKQPDMPIEQATDHISKWLLEHVENETEPPKEDSV